mmetsp:Transcript_112032/g.356060  ORF Transcript_112032/g.356060 Transcript_112032/m.356060 type:complete len:231 (-) Transcript_112032:4-696(-)
MLGDGTGRLRGHSALQPVHGCCLPRQRWSATSLRRGAVGFRDDRSVAHVLRASAAGVSAVVGAQRTRGLRHPRPGAASWHAVGAAARDGMVGWFAPQRTRHSAAAVDGRADVSGDGHRGRSGRLPDGDWPVDLGPRPLQVERLRQGARVRCTRGVPASAALPVSARHYGPATTPGGTSPTRRSREAHQGRPGLCRAAGFGEALWTSDDAGCADPDESFSTTTFFAPYYVV